MTAYILIEEIDEPLGSMLSSPEKIFHGYVLSEKKAKKWLAIMNRKFKRESSQYLFYIPVESLEGVDLNIYKPESYTKMYMHGRVIK